MRDTRTILDADVLSALEFDPICEAQTYIRLFGFTIDLWRCRKTADWSATSVCCGRQLFYCSQCLGTLNRCIICDKRCDSWKLVRL